MNYDEANQVAALLKEAGLPSVKVEHRGFISRRTPEAEMDGRWEVHVWSVSAAAGNRNLHIVRDGDVTDAASARRMARAANGKATARDRQALERAAAERSVNAE